MVYESDHPCILFVDDEPMIRDLLENIMASTQFSSVFAEDGHQALEKMARTRVDVVVTDVDMPIMDGIELIKIIKSKYTTDVIVMTGQIQKYQYDEIISIGASDFVEKPFSPREIILRINRVLKERELRRDALKAHKELQKSYIDSIHRLVMAAEFKDEDTGDHIVRIGEYCTLIARKIGMDTEFIDTIHYSAPMHDIGKIGIPDRILLKPGKLTNKEFDIIKTHTIIGAKLLSESNSKILQLAHQIAMNHHEKFNGKGYPHGLKGEDIPIAGRIVAIADSFDALTSKRPYKDPYPYEITYDIIKKERGEHFDPQVLDCFIDNFDLFREIRGKIGPSDGDVIHDFMFSERDQDMVLKT
ncbi:MAG: HD domain-containing phosphohydrolase [Pseudomonadota bacterium]